MKMRIVFAGAAALAALGGLHSPAQGQGFKPTRTVEAVVHTGPGGGSDVLARAVALMMEKEKLLPVRMQVVNKPGGTARWPRPISPRRRATRTRSASSPACGSQSAHQRRGQGHP